MPVRISGHAFHNLFWGLLLWHKQVYMQWFLRDTAYALTPAVLPPAPVPGTAHMHKPRISHRLASPGLSLIPYAAGDLVHRIPIIIILFIRTAATLFPLALRIWRIIINIRKKKSCTLKWLPPYFYLPTICANCPIITSQRAADYPIMKFRSSFIICWSR